MRRNYISPEWDYIKIPGTINMTENISLLSSKMLEIEDSLIIENQNLVYFQNSEGEQINLDVESSLEPLSYSSSEDKRINHTLEIDNTQSQSQKDNLSKWIIKIDSETILTNHIFALIKRYRTFEGLKNSITKNGNVDFAIKEYIIKNVVNRYKITKIDFYINYVNLIERGALKWNNVWAGYKDPSTGREGILPTDIIKDSNRLPKFETQTEYDYSKVTIYFTQEKKAQEFCFDYFFNLKYEKI